MAAKPISDTNVVSIRIPRAIYEDVREEARREKMTIADIIRRRISDAGNAKGILLTLNIRHEEMKRFIAQQFENLTSE